MSEAGHGSVLRDYQALGVPLVDLSGTPLSSSPLQDRMALAREHGPIFVIRFFERLALFVGGVDLMADLVDESTFAKNVSPALILVREIAGDGLFTAYNDEPNWAKAHDILLPAFAMSSMRNYHPTMSRVAKRMIASWDSHLATDGDRPTPVDVADDMTRMALDTIGLTGFGYDFSSFDSPEQHPFVQALVRGLLYCQKFLGRVPGGDYSTQDEDFRADAKYMAAVVDEVIAARQASGDTSTSDLLGLMLSAPHPATGELLDPVNIRNQVITFLIAGHETTSGALSFAMYYLMKNPAVLHRAQAEVDQLWGDQTDPDPTFEEIGSLRYIRQILNETLRLWPPAASFGREARFDTVIGGRYPLKAGEAAQVLAPMLHRDPIWGDNVDEFDPDRFSPEAEAARPAYAFQPFGTGERACIGRQFALHEATMLLGLLVHRYRFINHSHYQLRLRETLTIKPEGFTLTLAPRTPADRHVTRSAQATSVSLTAPAQAEEQATDLPTRVLHGTTVRVLHGSNLGTCRTYALQLADMLAGLGCEVSVDPLDTRAGALPVDSPVVIVASSYNGQPTDDAAEFVSWLRDAAPGSTEGVRYAVLGIGDRNWVATYQHVPTLIDDRLAACGAQRLVERGVVDVSEDLVGPVARFTTDLRRALLVAYGDPASVGDDVVADRDGPAYAVTEVTGGTFDALAARHELTPMTVVEASPLVDMSHPLGRSKRFLRIELPAGVNYRTADHFGLLPVNDPEVVERAAKILGVELDALLDIRPRTPGHGALPLDRPVTVSDLLSRYVELADVATPTQVAVLAAHNPCPPEQVALRALAADPEALAAGGWTVIDLIAEYPAIQERITWPVLLELLPPIRIRNYSISSSPLVAPDQVDLMVSLLDAPARSGRGRHRGVGSGYAHRLAPGDVVHARLQACRNSFRVLHTADDPVIMIGAGTGLAPFRGVIADRWVLIERGEVLAPALCYFGCDHPDVDYLHAEELGEAERQGAVSMRPVFALAPVDGHMFVQDRILAEGEEIWRLLRAGARVRVCGDGNRMAPGVRDAFQRVYSTHTGADAAAAERWMTELIGSGRYVEDVYKDR